MSRHARIVRIDRYDHFRDLRLPSGHPAKGRVGHDELNNAIAGLFLPEGGPAPDTALLFVAGHGLQTHTGIPEGLLAASDTRAGATDGLSGTLERRADRIYDQRLSRVRPAKLVPNREVSAASLTSKNGRTADQRRSRRRSRRDSSPLRPSSTATTKTSPPWMR